MEPTQLDILFDSIGILGVCCILSAYFLVQTEKVRPDQMIFPVINLIGAILLLISLMWTWNTASVIIEIAWILISLYGIATILRRRRHAKK